jgi:RNA polymerase sigma-70 factor (ECF subfamily)
MDDQAGERSDAALLRDYAHGDVASMDELVRRHGAALLGFLRAMTRDEDLAEDLFQETWLRVIRRPGGFSEGSFRAWLWRIARNLRIDRLRRRTHLSLDAVAGDEGVALVDTLAEPGRGPHEIAAGRDLAAAIAADVGRLPEAQREVFLLRTQAGLSFAEIAKLLKVPLNTALGRMHYAVTRLRGGLTVGPNAAETARKPGRGA